MKMVVVDKNFQILRKSGFFCGSGCYNCCISCRSGDFRQTNCKTQSHHQVVAIPKALGDGMFEIEKPMVFTYEEIRAATDEFSDSNLLGHGNYGSVYFGLRMSSLILICYFGSRAMVIGLGAVNIFGVIVLNSMLREMPVAESGFLTFDENIYPLLQVYAGSFFAIPLIRWFSIKRKNNQIENRNKARLQFARALKSPDIALWHKVYLQEEEAAEEAVEAVKAATGNSKKDKDRLTLEV